MATQLHITLLFFILVSLTSLTNSSTPSPEFSILDHANDFLSEEKVSELFGLWKQKHGKVYKHAQEAEKRFENFKKNLEYILQKNSRKSGHKVGFNGFADMSNEEFREIYMSKIKKPLSNKEVVSERSSLEREGHTASCAAPTSLDWRKYGIVTGVKNQGGCGSCWAFSTTGAIEGVNALVTGELVSLSEQELVDCDSTNEGCDGGDMDYAFEWVINNGGIDSESDYPYKAYDTRCNITKEEETKVVTIDGYKDVEIDENALFCAVVQQPVSVGMDGSALDFQLYTGGIYDGECSDDPDDIDHAVLIVGYGSEGGEDYWIVKNSWGTSWGVNGYIYIRRNTNLRFGVCAINAMASYPTKESYSTVSPYPSPAAPPPPRPSPPPPSPPPPSPSPSDCGDFSYCPKDETCCCLFEFFDYCLIYGCCAYENAVCCTGTEYCCPSAYPICDVEEGLCLKGHGDYLGVVTKKRKMAKHKLPWSKIEETEKEYQPLQWKRNQFAAMR
ncbi:hypothetical protein LguiB_004881 [Lonicera macranthoides]